jgi:dihydroorotase
LQQAAVSGNPKFFAGTDSAPHRLIHKESACGCAGIFSAPYAVALYAHVFDSLGQHHRLEPFLSHFGADFYQLPRNTQQLQLVNVPQSIPEVLSYAFGEIVPVAAGTVLNWSVHE